MIISLIGHSGILGKALSKRFPSAHKLSRFPSLKFFKHRVSNSLVINCAISKDDNIINQILTNIILPIYLSLFAKKYVHICSDCIFDDSDASLKNKESKFKISSFYSFSKILTFLFIKNKKNTIIIRTSFYSRDSNIIRDIRNGLTITAYNNFLWSGVTCYDLANFIEKTIHEKENGTFHFFSLTKSKFQILSEVADFYSQQPPKEKSLKNSKFRNCQSDFYTEFNTHTIDLD